MFKYKTAYFCANAKLSTQVATPVVNGCLTLGLLIDLASERIEDVSVSLNSDLARCIVKEYFVGKRVVKFGTDNRRDKYAPSRQRRKGNNQGIHRYSAELHQLCPYIFRR